MFVDCRIFSLEIASAILMSTFSRAIERILCSIFIVESVLIVLLFHNTEPVRRFLLLPIQFYFPNVSQANDTLSHYWGLIRQIRMTSRLMRLQMF